YHSPSATIKTARNTGDLKRGGMSPEEFSAKWKGHPAEKAFINGFKAIGPLYRFGRNRQKDD
ncbi:hypothetical protein, partial [Desulfobacula sp.]|uniref:hypothetical protein n=1 Tax=Desulfobacula sp. TaxID=2593537 RepID=UPI0039B8E247